MLKKKKMMMTTLHDTTLHFSDCSDGEKGLAHGGWGGFLSRKTPKQLGLSHNKLLLFIGVSRKTCKRRVDAPKATAMRCSMLDAGLRKMLLASPRLPQTYGAGPALHRFGGLVCSEYPPPPCIGGALARWARAGHLF